uniref:BEACH domain-containing protein n=1 Tax=Haemonchus contortus TaxID=6289 RepID=A0A7I4YFP4_HAECO
MRADAWDDTAFKELLIPAATRFIDKEPAVDVERETVLGTPVILRRLNRRFSDTKQEIELVEQDTAVCWKDVAHRFGTSYGRISREGLIESEYRPFRIIPHIIPIVAIIVKDETPVVITSELGADWVDLNTVLRHSYSNIEQYSQVHNFVAASLADVYYQLNLLKCYVTEPQFFCDNVFWLLCDPFVTNVDECPYEDFAYHSKTTSQWVSGSMSNYDYLLELNKAAGRVRGEIHNHPIFPWVCDFKEQMGGWRDLSKTKYRLTKGDDQLGQNFRHLSHHIPEVLSDIGYMVYKARVESKINLCKHVRSKWVPREYPASMARMYEWTPDECIPEFYDDPSILVSSHSDMPDLELPGFVSSPEEFIKWHRSMLESDQVSKHLHKWIDLNFGQALAGPVAVDSLNVHMCFSEPKRHRLCTNGMVQLFHRPHPKRLRTSNGQSLFDSNKNDFELIQDFHVESTPEIEPGAGTLLETYRSKIKKMKFNTEPEKMFLSFVQTLFRFRCHYLRFYPLEDFKKNNQRFLEDSHDLPKCWTDLIDELVDGLCGIPEPSQIPFYFLQSLEVPTEVANFHDAISSYYSFHLLRKSVAVQGNEKRVQAVLLRELDALKSAMEMTVMGNSLVRLFERMIFDEESAVQTVHRLFIVVCRSFDDQSFEQVLTPLVELLSCESSVKLLDRRFLLPASIAYGTSRFLREFLPTVIEAVASVQVDRSIVAKESVVWLSKRYGPVISARFITANLLRVLGSCYSGMTLIGSSQEPQSVFTLPLLGDECGARVEACLAEIAATYSVTFITVQYLPFCVDLVEQATRRLTQPIEAGLLAAFRIVRLSAKSMSDHQLMNYLEDYIVDKVIVKVLQLVLNANSSFSDDRSRIIVGAGVVSLLYNISMRIGLENTRLYARKPFELMFEAFGKLYEADDLLRISPKKLDPNEAVASIPLWFVSSVIDRFASSWGVPLLSSFCSDPAFLVPFVSSQVASSPSSLRVTPQYQLNSFPSGNRLLSLSSPSSHSNLSSIGGVGLCESTSLSALWCARISAAVCAAEGKSSLRFDHLTLCTFNGHSSSVRRIVSLSNENSFISASADKTVRLWSIKPEYDSVEAQWTYNRHQRPILDVTLLANNLIASTDGNLHVWDPFRGAIITQLDWDGDATICGLSHVDRHSMAAISSLHSTVRLIDTRTGGWTSELKVSNLPGLTRAFSVCESGRKMIVALSNGTLVLLDARTGRLASLSHGNSTHTTAIRWLSNSEFLVCDADEVGNIFAVNPRITSVRKLPDVVTSASVSDDKLATLQGSNIIRVYAGTEVVLEAKMKSDSQCGSPASICYLPLNNAYLIGSNQGSIRLMC